VENPNSIFVEQTEWGWAGGRLYSHAFRINPASVDVNLTAYADGLDLSKLLVILTGKEVSGAGTLYGKLPVTVKWPRMSFGDGFLYATPGTGRLTMGDNIGVVESLMNQSDARFTQDDKMSQVKSLMLESLRDFDYKALKVEFKNGSNGLVATIQAEGKGRSRPNLPEIIPTLNISGLDQLLNEVLVIKKGLSSIGQPQGASK
jgi:hypothetical protein